MDIGKVISDIFRQALWMVAEFCLQIMDIVYDVCEKIAIIDLNNFPWIWDWFKGVCVFLTLFIICRVGYETIKAMIDEDFRDKVNPHKLIIKIATVSLVIGMIPIFMPAFSSFAAEMNKNVSTILIGEDLRPSEVIIAVGYSGDTSSLDYDNIDINEKVDGEYVYFSGNFDIMFIVVASVVSCILFVFIAIQIAQRIFGLALKVLIAPFSVSSIVSFEDDSFSTWLKLIVADLLTTWFQLALIMLVLTGVSLVDLGGDLTGLIAKVVFFIGGLMAVMVAPSGIAQLLGGDVGMGTALQQLQNLAIVSTGFKVAGAVSGVAAATGAYAGARALGANSLLKNASFLQNATGQNNINGGSGGIPSGVTGGSSSGGVGSGAFTNMHNMNMNGNNGVSSSGSGSVNDNASGTSSGNFSAPYSQVSSGSGYSGGNLVKENSILGRIARKNENSHIGRVMNRAGASMYMSSAKRLARPVVSRTVRGGFKERNSAFVMGSQAEDAIRKGFRDINGVQ